MEAVVGLPPPPIQCGGPTVPVRYQLRVACPRTDADVCAAIYAPYVSTSAASFEYVVPSAVEIAARMGNSHVWLVVEVEGLVVGFAYGSRHREREAYQWAADVAIYIDAAYHRQGLGRGLYEQLFERLYRIGLWVACAGITEPNPASSGLHEAMGFQFVGIYRRIGWKDGRWHDVSWWQLDLRPGDDGLPGEICPNGD